MEPNLTPTAATDPAWHAMAVDDVVSRLSTDATTGLTAAETSERLEQHGPNRLPEGKRRGALIGAGVGALGGFLYDQHRKGNID